MKKFFSKREPLSTDFAQKVRGQTSGQKEHEGHGHDSQHYNTCGCNFLNAQVLTSQRDDRCN